MNNKTIIEFSFPIIMKNNSEISIIIMEISEGVIRFAELAFR